MDLKEIGKRLTDSEWESLGAYGGRLTSSVGGYLSDLSDEALRGNKDWAIQKLYNTPEDGNDYKSEIEKALTIVAYDKVK